MTPDELQRVLSTDGERQRNLDQLDGGRGWPAFIILLVATFVFIYLYGSS